ncbi:MAG: hypothetical protein KME57_20400 [Scytonema hyalinum WJT4-NPBG1]|nr:hypothetical protein [Scytonema hyalinum WJT4-NPBG1]
MSSQYQNLTIQSSFRHKIFLLLTATLFVLPVLLCDRSVVQSGIFVAVD